MKNIIDWEILDNEEVSNSIAPLGVGNLGGSTPIILVGDRDRSYGSGGSPGVASTAHDRRSRDKNSGSRVIKGLDEAIEDPTFDIRSFEDVMEIWNYDYGGS